MSYLLNRRKYVPRRNPQGAPADLADATITVSPTVPYTGSPVYPDVIVEYDGAVLIVNTDYLLNYTDNVNEGLGTVTVTGIGNYVGSVVKTFRIETIEAGAWKNFMFETMANSVGDAGLTDSTSAYYSGEPIDTYGLQLLPDGSLFFAAQHKGYMYIWGFEDGHPFEVAHFNPSYTSRSPLIDYLGGATLKPDGTLGVRGSVAGNTLYKVAFSTAYALNTLSGAGTESGASGQNIYRVAFSTDGTRLFYKGKEGDYIYWWNLSTPFNISSKSGTGSVNLDEIAGTVDETVTWRAFFFSPDGRHMVATSGSGAASVHKFKLARAWDLTTATRISHKQIFANGNHYPEAVAVNADGTKMIVFDRESYFTAFKFYEFDLPDAVGIGEADIVLSGSSFAYTGSEIKPTVTVTFDGNTLVEGVDYTLAYSNNTACGTATVRVSGIGGYIGSVAETFTIEPAGSIEDEEAEISVVSPVSYTGRSLEPTVTVTYDGTTLKRGVDYTLSYSNNINVGTGTVVVAGKGGYLGRVTETFTIEAVNLSNATISVVSPVTINAGSAAYPAVTVTHGGRTLSQGTDYTLTYSNNTAVGTGTVVVTGKGGYTGNVSKNFTICYDISTATITLPTDTYTYTGSAITPTPTVKYGSTTLTLDTDYTLSYSNNTNGGTGYVIVTGKGGYTGTATKSFTICYDISVATISVVSPVMYTGSALTPAVTVTHGGRTLSQGTDYTLTYSNNTAVGTGTVVVTGKGGYTGSVSENFTISKMDIAELRMLVSSPMGHTGSVLNPDVRVPTVGTRLGKGVDYTLSYYNNINNGEATVTITGSGNNYEGSKTIPFVISGDATGSGGWSYIDAANLSGPVETLFEGDIKSRSAKQLLPDGRILFVDNGIPSIQGFAQSGDFSPSKMKSSYDSIGVEACNEAWIGNSGSYLFMAKSDGKLYRSTLGTPYDLSSQGSSSLLWTPYSTLDKMSFSSDGTKLFYVESNDRYNDLCSVNLSSAWSFSGVSSPTKMRLKVPVIYQGRNHTRDFTIRHFVFSPDGTVVILIGYMPWDAIFDTSGMFLTRYNLSTAWDISSIAFDSRSADNFYATTSGAYVSGNRINWAIANAAGTKMMLNCNFNVQYIPDSYVILGPCYLDALYNL